MRRRVSSFRSGGAARASPPRHPSPPSTPSCRQPRRRLERSTPQRQGTLLLLVRVRTHHINNSISININNCGGSRVPLSLLPLPLHPHLHPQLPPLARSS